MTNGLTSPKAAQGPRTPEAGPAPEAARGAPPPSDAFAGILGDAQQARTATAEGQSPEKPKAGDDCASSAQPVDQADTPAPDATAAVAAVMAALPVPVSPEAPATAAPVDGAAPVADVANPVAVPAGVEQIAPVAQQAGAPANVEVAPVVMPGAKPEGQVGPPSAQQVAPEAPKSQPQPVTTWATGQPGAAAGAAPQSGAQQQTEEHPLPQPAPQQPAAPQPQQAAPVAPSTPAAPPAEAARPAPLPTPIATPVPLARAAEAVEHVLHIVATRGGVTHARIALHPDSLGSVDVHIRSTAEGLVARVVAHTAEAVQTLQNAANDLRQSLEEQGLTLASLDIGQPGERRAGDREHERGGHASTTDEASVEAETTTTETLRLPTGVLVDVLA